MEWFSMLAVGVLFVAACNFISMLLAPGGAEGSTGTGTKKGRRACVMRAAVLLSPSQPPSPCRGTTAKKIRSSPPSLTREWVCPSGQ